MSRIERIAMTVAGSIFLTGSIFALNKLNFPEVSILTLHFYLMMLAGIALCLPLIIGRGASDVDVLDNKVQRMAKDLRRVIRSTTKLWHVYTNSDSEEEE